MWAEFEWENKVSVRTSITSLRGYLQHILKTTNMRCLTPESALAGECDFLAANLYARSVFGEDALANLSIEKLADGSVTGHIRIRSKTQGIALRFVASGRAGGGEVDEDESWQGCSSLLSFLRTTVWVIRLRSTRRRAWRALAAAAATRRHRYGES